MFRKICSLSATLLITLMSLERVTAQAAPAVWKSFAERIAVGTELNVRLNDGHPFRATLVGAQDDAVLLQPKTRMPVPVQAVPYGEIVRMEPRKPGIGAGKAVAVGVASGVGAFFGILALLFAINSD